MCAKFLAEKDSVIPRIVIVSGFPLVQNPRVVKEADALSDAGFDVHVLSAIFSPGQMEAQRRRLEGRVWTHHNIANAFGNSRERLHWHYRRIRKRLGRSFAGDAEARLALAIHNDVPTLIHRALSLNGDWYSLHLEPSLLVGAALTRAGKPFSVDFEDWYSEDHVYGDTSEVYETLRSLEGKVTRGCRFATTTSAALSDALAEAYSISPTVVYNSFPASDYRPYQVRPRQNKALRLNWFSQTVGRGRGLELVLDAIPQMCNPVELNLRGNISQDFRNEIQARVAGAEHASVFFHDLCYHDELLGHLAQDDVGLATDQPACRSRDLTITNKILQYMQAGLHVVASNTAGHREVAALAGDSVQIFPDNSTKVLADLLDGLAVDRQRLEGLKRESLNSFKNEFSWGQSEAQLAQLFSSAISREFSHTSRSVA